VTGGAFVALIAVLGFVVRYHAEINTALQLIEKGS
jgi:hypothetical protein